MTDTTTTDGWRATSIAQIDPQHGDAFGETLLAALDAGAVSGAENEIVERDDGFIVAMDTAHYFTSKKSWSEPVQWAIEQAFGRVVDIGVGAGRHALAAQLMGCEVSGLDISPGALEVSRRQGVHNLVLGSVHNADELFASDSFDCVFMLGQNLALLGSPDGAGDVFRALYEITSPGAIIIGDSLDPSLSQDAHRAYFEFNRSRGRWSGHFTLRVRWRGIASPWFDYLFCTPDELAGLAEPHGWRLRDMRSKGATYAVVLQRM